MVNSKWVKAQRIKNKKWYSKTGRRNRYASIRRRKGTPKQARRARDFGLSRFSKV